MSLPVLLFAVVAAATAASALGVVLSRNIVRSALWLLFTLIGVSLIYFLLGAEFTKVWASHHGSAEAFAARTAAPGTAPVAISPVERIVAHKAKFRRSIGLFDVAALVTIVVAARSKR